jgi:hypothetical protein
MKLQILFIQPFKAALNNMIPDAGGMLELND